MLGCFHLVSPLHLSFLYCPFAKAFQMFSRIMWADKEVPLLLWRGITLLSPGKSSNKHWQQQWALKGHLRSLELEGKNTAPSCRSYITGGTQTGASYTMKMHCSGKETLHIPQWQQAENVPLCLRWDGMSLTAWQKEQMSQCWLLGSWLDAHSNAIRIWLLGFFFL